MQLINKKFKRYAGLDWPINMPDFEMALTLGRFGHSPKYWERILGERKTAEELGIDPGDQMVRAISSAFPAHVFDTNRWASSTISSVINYRETFLLGSAGAGKSTSVAALALMWWLPACNTTTIFLSSTSKDGLRRRVWAYVAEYFDYLKQHHKIGAIHNRQMTAILNESDMKAGVSADSVRSGIFGIAVESGDDIQVAGRIGGVHQSTKPGASDFGEGGVMLIGDEINAMSGSSAWFKAVANLSVGCDLFRLASMANPWSSAKTGAVGARATPPRGFDSLNPDTDRDWISTTGAHVIRLDAYDSPGVIDDPVRYSYLPTLDSIDIIRQECDGNEKDPRFLSMARALVSDSMAFNTVFSGALQERYKVAEDIAWMNDRCDYTTMGVDPAFTEGGDRCAIAVTEVGLFRDGVYGVRIADLSYAKIDGTSATPVSYQIQQQVEELRRQYDVAIHLVYVDSTGTQTIADNIEVEAGEFGCGRVSFSSRATDDPVSDLEYIPSYQKFGSIRGQMWFKAREYARAGQLKNLPDDAAVEFATRQLAPKKLLDLESKAEYKKRMGGTSPDAGDAVALALFAAFQNGLMPGATVSNRRGGYQSGSRPQRSRSVDYDECSYTSFELA